MNKKRQIRNILLCGLFLLVYTNVFAMDTPELFLNGKLKDVQVILKNATALVPLRFCSEELQATVNWNEVTKEIMIIKENEHVQFTIGSNTYTHNGESKELLAEPELINGTTYIPFRPLVEALNGVVLYNNENKLINIHDRESDAYRTYKALNSNNLIEQRFALLEAPRKSFEGSYGGSRADTYIFPLGEGSDYFFRYYADDVIYGMDYFKLHDGIAVQEWSRTQVDSTPLFTAKSSLLKHIGEGVDIKEIGSFPSLQETDFVGFRNITFEASKANIENMYAIGNTVCIINENGWFSPGLKTPNKLVFSPFGSLFYLAEFDEKLFR